MVHAGRLYNSPVAFGPFGAASRSACKRLDLDERTQSNPMTLPAWSANVEQFLDRQVRTGVWVVAVSGGSDSVGLLRVLHALAPRAGLTLSVAHLDHGTRGAEGKADAAFVASLAETLGLAFDLGHWRPTRPGHFEADARQARYDWLLEVARARGAEAMAVGHTRDDQAETVLHRLVRGTGLRGLAGMPRTRSLDENIQLVRPLLPVSRAEIRGYLAALGQPFREDATNLDGDRTRSRIRHKLLPLLRSEYNPKVAEALVRLAALSAGSTRALERRARKLARLATRPAPSGEVVLAREPLVHQPTILRAEVMRLVWREAGWPEQAMSEARWRRLARLVQVSRPGVLDIGAGVVATTGPVLLTLRRSAETDFSKTNPISPDPRPVEIPGTVDWADGRLTLTLDPVAACDESIDLDRLIPPLVIRNPLPGDRFNALGMAGKTTPLNDFLRARRVPRWRRSTVPLLCDALGIVWVVGHRIAHRVRLTEHTQRTVGLTWETPR